MLDPLQPLVQYVLPGLIGFLGGALAGAAMAARGMRAATALDGRQRYAWATVISAGLCVWALYTGRLQDLLPMAVQPYVDLALHPAATFLATFVIGFLTLLERDGWSVPSERRRVVTGVGITSLLLLYLGWLSVPVRPTEDLAVDDVVFQTTPFSCAAASIATIARLTGVAPALTEREAAGLARTTHGGTLVSGEIRALRALGLEARFGRRLTVDSLLANPGPAILHVNEPVAGGRRIRHSVALLAVDLDEEVIRIGNPLEGTQEVAFADLASYWIGEAVFVRRTSAPEPTPAPPPPPPPPPAGLLGAVDELRESPSGGEWARRRGQSPLALLRFGPSVRVRSFAGSSDWCLLGVDTLDLADGVQAERLFYFYVDPEPAASTDFSLAESDDGPTFAYRECRLGTVSTRIVRSPAPRAIEAEALDSLTARFGAGTSITNRDLPRRLTFGTAYWDEITTWTADELTAGLTWHEDGYPIVFAYLPSLEGPLPPFGDRRRIGEWEVEVMEYLFEQADLPPATVAAVADLRGGEVGQGLMPDADPLLEAVRLLTQRPGTEAPEVTETYGARLIATDLLLLEVAPAFWERGGYPVERVTDSLTAFGARYPYMELGGANIYQRSLLGAAVTVAAPDGRLADLAALLELERSCRSVASVITTAEGLLARLAEPTWVTRAHFLLGEAHTTVVALSEGALGEFYPPDPYRERAPRSRELAVEHYRHALEGDLDPILKQRAWQTAWALQRHLFVDARYACVND